MEMDEALEFSELWVRFWRRLNSGYKLNAHIELGSFRTNFASLSARMIPSL